MTRRPESSRWRADLLVMLQASDSVPRREYEYNVPGLVGAAILIQLSSPTFPRVKTNVARKAQNPGHKRLVPYTVGKVYHIPDSRKKCVPVRMTSS